MKPRVGVDLDGVFADLSTPLLKEIAKLGFGEFTEEDITAYNFSDWLPGFTKQHWEHIYYRGLLSQPHFFERLEPYSEEDMDFLRELCRVVDVYVVSARGETASGLTSITHQTAAWCRRNNLPVAGVFINPDHKKASALRFLGCKNFIDDSPETFVNCLESGIDVWLYDKPWNRHIKTGKRIYKIWEYYKIVRGEF